MKIFLAFVVLAALAALAWWLLPDMEIDRAGKNAPPPAGLGPSAADPARPKHDFTEISTLLQGDMDRIPATLGTDRAVPSHAFTIKAQLQTALGQHEEYRVLDRVCDIIIQADQDRAIRERDCQVALSRVYTSPLNDTDAEKHNRPRREQIQKDAETAWATARKQADDEVHRLLATLANKQL